MNDVKEKAIVCISGGMDSCVTVAIAAKQYELMLLHISYGQRTATRELKAFTDIAHFYNVPEERTFHTSVEYLKKIGGSSLTDKSIDVAKGTLNRKGIPSSYVPFRNTHIIAIATSLAEVTGAVKIFVGANQLDSSGYPDCRKEYFDAYNNLIALGTKPETHIEIVTPLIDYTKAEIVTKGIELNAPLHLSWSCYKSETVACGQCDSCLLRLKGFAEASAVDPIPYR